MWGKAMHNVGANFGERDNCRNPNTLTGRGV